MSMPLCIIKSDEENALLQDCLFVSQATEGKALLLSEEMAAIHAGLLQGSLPTPYDDEDDAVPEELFRRYTETDSRPLTPAPTLASVMTKGSVRRCVTPDPIPTHILNPARERTLLVVDLRRSHSQDTISWQGLSLPTSSTLKPLTRNTTPVQKTDQNVYVPQKNKIGVKKKGAVSQKIEENDKNANQKVQYFYIVHKAVNLLRNLEHTF